MSLIETTKCLKDRFEDMAAPEILQLSFEEFGDKIAVVSSFGAEAAVLLAMAADIKPGIPVIFLDTKKLFAETLAYRDELTAFLGLDNVKTYYPDYNNIQRYDENGTLHQNKPNHCCHIRKVEPLQRALKGYDAWVTGRKRFHGGFRSDLPLIELSDGKVKINPLAKLSPSDIKSEFKRRGLPEHPLTARGYTSIGCLPCTDLPSSEGDIRSGRWAGQDKTECGIHFTDDGKLVRSGP